MKTASNVSNKIVAKVMGGLFAVALVLGVSVSLTACGEPAESASPQAVLESYVDAINNNDFAKALSFVKDTGEVEADKILPIDTANPIEKPLAVDTEFDKKADKVQLKFELDGEDKTITFVKSDKGYQLAVLRLIDEKPYAGYAVVCTTISDSHCAYLNDESDRKNSTVSGAVSGFENLIKVTLADGTDVKNFSFGVSKHAPTAKAEFLGNEYIKPFSFGVKFRLEDKDGDSSPGWGTDELGKGSDGEYPKIELVEGLDKMISDCEKEWQSWDKYDPSYNNIKSVLSMSSTIDKLEIFSILPQGKDELGISFATIELEKKLPKVVESREPYMLAEFGYSLKSDGKLKIVTSHSSTVRTQ